MRECQNCGHPFEPVNGELFCSDWCGAEAQDEEDKVRRRLQGLDGMMEDERRNRCDLWTIDEVLAREG